MATLPHTFEVPGGQSVTIYAETPNINYFIRGDLEPDTVDGVINKQVSVGGSSRSQYPGDPTPINVSGSSRQFLVDASRKSGAALPGKSFRLAALNEQGQVIERRQFSYKGRWLDLHAFLTAEAAYKLYAYNNTGARYTIEATADPAP